MALILLALGGLLVVPALNLASTSLNYHRVVEKNTLENYAADAGVDYALVKLGNEPGEFGPEPLPSEVNDRTVNVTIKYIYGNIYKITSTATTDSGSSTSIESYVALYASMFDYGMAALDGNITMTGNAEVTSLDILSGDVYANGDINMSGNSEVDGDATATGDINLSANASIAGGIDDLAVPLEFAEIETSVYLGEANQGTLIEGNLNINTNGYYDLGPTHITGNLTISGNAIVRLTGTVWIDGTISMSGNTNIEGSATIVAVGNIQVTGNTKLDPDDIPLIISTDGNITATGNSWTSAILYAPNGGIVMSGNSKVYGCVIGESISASGNNVVEYVTGLRGRGDLPGSGGLEILTWQISG